MNDYRSMECLLRRDMSDDKKSRKRGYERSVD